ncbi:MAG: hypothetical protein ABIM74_05200 [candidate division WOR-3 bacterium]
MIEILLISQLFSKTYGGGNHERAYSLLRTSDGAYALCGYTASYGFGDNDIMLIKVNSSGSLSWARAFGGYGRDEGCSMIQLPTGDYVISGHTRSFGDANGDAIVMCVNSSGNLSWAKTFGGSALDEAYAIARTSDGGFAVVGATRSSGAGEEDAFLVKLNSSGDILWAKTIGTTTYDYGYSVCEASDNGIVLAGYIYRSGGSDDILVMKTDAVGNLLWAKSIGGTSYDYAYSVIPTSDGGLAVAGYTGSWGAGGADAILIKLTSGGSLSWTRVIGGSGWDEARTVIQTSDGAFLISGYTTSWGSGGEAWLAKVDPTLGVLWSRTFGGSNYEYLYDVIEASGGLAGAGTTWSYGAGNTDFLLLTMDQQGNLPGCLVARSPSLVQVSPSSFDASGFATWSVSSVSRSLSQANPSLSVSDACVPTQVEEGPSSTRGIRTRLEPGLLILYSDCPVSGKVFSSDGSLVWSGIVSQEGARIGVRPGVYFWAAGREKGKAPVCQ